MRAPTGLGNVNSIDLHSTGGLAPTAGPPHGTAGTHSISHVGSVCPSLRGRPAQAVAVVSYGTTPTAQSTARGLGSVMHSSRCSSVGPGICEWDSLAWACSIDSCDCLCSDRSATSSALCALTGRQRRTFGHLEQLHTAAAAPCISPWISRICWLRCLKVSPKYL